jgi:hypothetical protein
MHALWGINNEDLIYNKNLKYDFCNVISNKKYEETKHYILKVFFVSFMGI